MNIKQRKIWGSISIITGLSLYVYSFAIGGGWYSVCVFGIGSLILVLGAPLYPKNNYNKCYKEVITNMKRENWIKLFIAIGIILLILGVTIHNIYLLAIGGLISALAGSRLGR